jgi:hypothetical protein
MFFLKPDTLVGFEPGSAASEADAMSTAQRRQGAQLSLFKIYFPSSTSMYVCMHVCTKKATYLHDQAL